MEVMRTLAASSVVRLKLLACVPLASVPRALMPVPGSRHQVSLPKFRSRAKCSLLAPVLSSAPTMTTSLPLMAMSFFAATCTPWRNTVAPCSSTPPWALSMVLRAAVLLKVFPVFLSALLMGTISGMLPPPRPRPEVLV